MSTLPKFRKMRRDDVEAFINALLTQKHELPPRQYLRQLIEYDDKHFRAIFEPSYFMLAEGQSEPSKSQWNNLKKKIKRHDSRIFLFKEHGTIQVAGEKLYYLDFGFFLE